MLRAGSYWTGVPARATGAGRHPIGSPTLGCARNPGGNVVVFETVFQHRAHRSRKAPSASGSSVGLIPRRRTVELVTPIDNKSSRSFLIGVSKTTTGRVALPAGTVGTNRAAPPPSRISRLGGPPHRPRPWPHRDRPGTHWTEPRGHRTGGSGRGCRWGLRAPRCHRR